MRIRVYISATESYVFDNISSIKDGSDFIEHQYNKLVLLRRGKRTIEMGHEVFEVETVAVFNQWMFWKLLPDLPKKV